VRKALIALSALTLLAGCSAARSQYTPVQAPATREAQTEQYIFVTQYSANSLTKFTLDGQMVWTTTTALASPEGVTVDASGKLYVANGNDTVTTYDQNGNQTTPTITTGLDLPFGVAVVTRTGLSGCLARSSRISSAAALTSPTETACSQMLGSSMRRPQPNRSPKPDQ